MKKWMIAIGVIFILTLLCIFLFIPSKIVISKLTTATATINGEIRSLSSEDRWEQWWRDERGKAHEKGKPFTYNGTQFHLTTHENKAIGILIEGNGLKINSFINLFSFTVDSTLALWECALPAGNNPISRIKNYRKAVEIRKDMVAVIENFKNFVSDPSNIYGRKIHRDTISDTLLLSTRFQTKNYPTTPEIYHYLGLLEANIKKQKATITGYPMLHVNKLGEGTFETQLALPTNIWLKDDGPYYSRRMVKGYFLITEVKGGEYAVNLALEEMENYVIDYSKTKMAISFQFLVTNRVAESDTTKWVTRIYMPVVE